MEIYKNAIKTDRAFIPFNNIQHISWKLEFKNEYEVKIYSNAQAIIQPMSADSLTEFLKHYKQENENEIGTYWVKLHMGAKEARYVSRDINDLQLLLTQWTNVRGKRIELEIEEIEGE